MAQEIERKFLVTDFSWRHSATKKLYRQGYLPTQDQSSVRVRIAGEQGYLTVKGPNAGLTRLEYEYEIPRADSL
ncbi:MAG: CYTH domain-containing protein [Leptolyngbyaceae cyanobacterium]